MNCLLLTGRSPWQAYSVWTYTAAKLWTTEPNEAGLRPLDNREMQALLDEWLEDTSTDSFENYCAGCGLTLEPLPVDELDPNECLTVDG